MALRFLLGVFEGIRLNFLLNAYFMLTDLSQLVLDLAYPTSYPSSTFAMR